MKSSRVRVSLFVLLVFSAGLAVAPPVPAVADVSAEGGELTALGPPMGRTDSRAVWDSINNRLLVFGGYIGGPHDGPPSSRELWAYDPQEASWLLLRPKTEPPPGRVRHAVAWDAAGERLFLFGGNEDPGGGLGPRLDDLWSYSVSTNEWTEHVTSGEGPPGRESHSMVWDEVNSQLLVFGGTCKPNGCGGNGRSRSCTCFLRDLWAYQPGTNEWTLLDPGSDGPSERREHSAVWDPDSRRMLIFGGLDLNGLRDLWSWNPTFHQWTRLADGPVASAAVWAKAHRVMAVFGVAQFCDPETGVCDAAQQPYVYDPETNAWTALRPGGPNRTGTGAWDEAGNRMLAYGLSELAGELWSYSLTSDTWTELSPADLYPRERQDATAVWDENNQEVLIFGRETNCPAGGPCQDLWAYNPAAGRWRRLEPAASPTSPGPRSGHTAIWDSGRSRMVIFGGSGSGLTNDVWAYSSTTNSWEELVAEGDLPGPRYGHTAVFDSASDRMLVFGGRGSEGGMSDLWSFDLQTHSWARLAEGPRRYDHVAVWDPIRLRMLVFGGNVGSYPYCTRSVYSYDPSTNTWSSPTISGGSPPAVVQHSAVWDTKHHRMVAFVGGGCTYTNELWALDAGAMTWERLSPAGDYVASRWNTAAAWDSGRAKMYLFGGQRHHPAGLNDLNGYSVAPPRHDSALALAARNLSQGSQFDTRTSVYPGDVVRFRFSYSNQGTRAVDDVEIRVAVPARSEFVGCTGGCSGSGIESGSEVSWLLGQQSSGSSLTVTLDVKFALDFLPGDPEVDAQATVTTKQGGPVSSNRVWVQSVERRPYYLAFGTSIPSGHGLKPYYEVGRECKRSTSSFPFHLSQGLEQDGLIDPWMPEGHEHAYLAFHRACTGATSEEVLQQVDPAVAMIRGRASSGAGTLDAYVSLDAGINDFGFAWDYGHHVFCDLESDFRSWVRTTIEGVQRNLYGSEPLLGTPGISGIPDGEEALAPSEDSILGKLLGAGSTVIAMTGYHDAIEGNLEHPLITLWKSNAGPFCYVLGVPESQVIERTEWAFGELETTLRETVVAANRFVPPGPHGPRVRFVSLQDTFRGNVACDSDESYLQKVISAGPRNWTDGNDCIHPSRKGASAIADRVQACLLARMPGLVEDCFA